MMVSYFCTVKGKTAGKKEDFEYRFGICMEVFEGHAKQSTIDAIKAKLASVGFFGAHVTEYSCAKHYDLKDRGHMTIRKTHSVSFYSEES